jgi:hypothetical protein
LLFAHLTDKQVPRARVLVDGDDAGRAALEKLRTDFKGWPAGHFRELPADDFEQFYPPRFAEDVAALAAVPDARERMKAKGRLAVKVAEWSHEQPEQAAAELAVSAAPVTRP